MQIHFLLYFFIINSINGLISFKRITFLHSVSLKLYSSSSNDLSELSDLQLDNNIKNDLNPKIQKFSRRQRYSGKYPKQFHLKYKERNGNISTIEKVLLKGGTPAGQHVSIMVKECIEHLNVRRNSSVPLNLIDCTLGFGGHSLMLLQETKLNCRLIAFDKDVTELSKTQSRINDKISKKLLSMRQSNEVFIPIHDSFANSREHIQKFGLVGRIDAILADLGVSSMQIDNPERGFSFKADGPLDMRMNRTSYAPTAFEILQMHNVSSLSKIISTNSDELYAPFIAEAIYSNGLDYLPDTTLKLTECIRNGVNNGRRNDKLNKASKVELDKSIARTMQSLRIEVNKEFEDLDKLLQDIPSLLRSGGKVVILTFHSGEDRRVKKAFKDGFQKGLYSFWSRDVIRPTWDETRQNPRSKCAKLR